MTEDDAMARLEDLAQQGQRVTEMVAALAVELLDSYESQQNDHGAERIRLFMTKRFGAVFGKSP